jgi:hypothetical protein
MLMAFKKGKSKTGGRSKGVENKLTADIKIAVKELLERNAPEMDVWLKKVAKRSPYKALDLIYKFTEYSMPRLSRVQADITTKGDKINSLSDEELNARISKFLNPKTEEGTT